MSKEASVYTLVVLCTCHLCVSAFVFLLDKVAILEKLFPESVVRDACPVEHSVAPSLWQFDQ